MKQAFISIMCFCLTLVSCSRPSTWQHDEGMVFGTVYSITYFRHENLQSDIESVLQQVDDALSMFNENSIISRVNQGEQFVEKKGEGSMFLDVFHMAQEISDDTEGSFDITVAPLVNIWGFGFKSGQKPNQHAIDSLMQFIGYEKTSYDGQRIVKRDPRIMLDCSAIAKGYGTDVVAQALDEKGVKNYLVEIGGEIVTRGVSERRLPWKIGVTKPTDNPMEESNELQTVLNVTDKAMATSGNYRNFYYKGGKRYAHTIDPKTGYPVQHNILSATVLTDHCARADAFATAFMVMGFERAKQVLKDNPDLMAYFIYDDNGQNKVWYSPSLKDKIAE